MLRLTRIRASDRVGGIHETADVHDNVGNDMNGVYAYCIVVAASTEVRTRWVVN